MELAQLYVKTFFSINIFCSKKKVHYDYFNIIHKKNVFNNMLVTVGKELHPQ
jgi:hypothetical protein